MIDLVCMASVTGVIGKMKLHAWNFWITRLTRNYWMQKLVDRKVVWFQGRENMGVKVSKVIFIFLTGPYIFSS